MVCFVELSMASLICSFAITLSLIALRVAALSDTVLSSDSFAALASDRDAVSAALSAVRDCDR